MTKQAKDVVNTITRSKLSDYGVTEKREAPTAKTTAPRKTYTQKYTPKPATSYADYAKRVPAIQTPSALSKAKVDGKLMALRELPWPEDTARYSRSDYERLVSVLADYVLDVTEGAGLINQGTAGTALRDALSALLPDHFKHLDPHDGKYRVISVEDK